MSLIPRMAACLLLMLMSGAASAQVGENLGPIPDGGLPGTSGADNFGPPRDVTFNVTGRTGTVSSVTVGFNAGHTYVGDLRVTLIAPNGVPHILFSRTLASTEAPFGSGADLVASNGYSFGDTATTNWWTHVASNSATIPAVAARTTIEGGAGVTAPATVTSLDAAFASTPPNGIWTLRFEDGAAGDTGSVTQAILLLSTSGGNRTVTTDADSGAGSLRAAMAAAQSGDLIVFASPFFDTARSIDLLTALPNIIVPLAIRGPGAHLLTVRRDDVAPNFRIFNIVFFPGAANLSGMTVSNGSTNAAGGGIQSVSPLTLSAVQVTGNLSDLAGAGVSIDSSSGSPAVTIVNSTISGNIASIAGGGLALNRAVAVIVNSTISSNRAGSFAGGIVLLPSNGQARLELSNSTVVDNVAGSGSGGIDARSQAGGGVAAITLRNSIIANNVPLNLATTAAGGGTATITSRGFNLSNDYNGVVTLTSDRTGDARLGPLALNGGTVPTHALLGGSLALDNGNASAGLSLGGARGEPRTFDIASIPNASGGNGSDIGAVEMQAIFVSNTASSGANSLNAAIAASNSNGPGLDDILFDSTAFATPQTINLNAALPEISSALTISGPGADLLTVQRAAATDFRILTVGGGLPTVAFSGMTLANGQAEFGGGIFSFSPLSLTAMHVRNNVDFQGTTGGGLYLAADGRISSSTFSDGVAPFGGGGVTFFGDGGLALVITGSTFSGNSGGAVRHVSASGDSTLHILNSSIANNSNDAAIFAITQGSGTSARTLLRNSIVANNTPQNFQLQSLGPGPASIVSRGFNLTNTATAFLNQSSDQNSANAGLAPLANNGGPVPTFALLANSDALDAGNAGGSGAIFDQRGAGFARTIDLALVNAVDSDGTDIGAFEAQTAPVDRPPLIFGNGFEAPAP